jgi:hypothetical protein
MVEIAIPMDKRAIHLVDKLNFQITVRKGEVFIQSQEVF